MRNIKQKNTLWYASLSIFCLFSFSMLLSACEQAQNNDGKIHLKLWYWNRSIDDGLINAVSKQFPNIVLEADKINDYDNKVRTTLAGHYGVPDILGINTNVAPFFPDEDQFVDLKTLGAEELHSQYLDWKWNLGMTPSGRMIAFPMDTGPTALFYRADIFKQAGLPYEPDAVANSLKTWDDYIQAGVKLKNATGGKSMMFDTATTIYTQMMAQSSKQYFDPSGKFIGDQAQIKNAWNEATKVVQMGLSAKLQMWTTDWNKGIVNGLTASFVGAAWMKQILQETAPATAGKWRVTYAPGGAGNSGGSFLAITKASQHPKEAFEVIKWLQSPENQVVGYTNIQLFPSTISAFSAPQLHQAEAFYGGEDTTKIFAQSATQIPRYYMGPDDGTVSGPITDQLALVEFQHKTPDQAWTDAIQRGQRELLR